MGSASEILPCPSCSGHGRHGDITCDSCHGTCDQQCSGNGRMGCPSPATHDDDGVPRCESCLVEAREHARGLVIADAIARSVRTCLAVHGIALTDAQAKEAGNNAAQLVVLMTEAA